MEEELAQVNNTRREREEALGRVHQQLQQLGQAFNAGHEGLHASFKAGIEQDIVQLGNRLRAGPPMGYVGTSVPNATMRHIFLPTDMALDQFCVDQGEEFSPSKKKILSVKKKLKEYSL